MTRRAATSSRTTGRKVIEGWWAGQSAIDGHLRLAAVVVVAVLRCCTATADPTSWRCLRSVFRRTRSRTDSVNHHGPCTRNGFGNQRERRTPSGLQSDGKCPANLGWGRHAHGAVITGALQGELVEGTADLSIHAFEGKTQPDRFHGDGQGSLTWQFTRTDSGPALIPPRISSSRLPVAFAACATTFPSGSTGALVTVSPGTFSARSDVGELVGEVMDRGGDV